VTRSAVPYGERRALERSYAGFDTETPVAGFYRVRLGADTVAIGIRIWFGAPLDPVTGEEMDRGWRWQAQCDDGSLIDLERVWPACARRPISEADFRMREGRRRWAQRAAPDSAYANRGQKYDPLSSDNPLPF